MESLKEKLKIDILNSDFWLKRSNDKSDNQISLDKTWVKEFNKWEKEIINYFNLLNH